MHVKLDIWISSSFWHRPRATLFAWQHLGHLLSNHKNKNKPLIAREVFALSITIQYSKISRTVYGTAMHKDTYLVIKSYSKHLVFIWTKAAHDWREPSWPSWPSWPLSPWEWSTISQYPTRCRSHQKGKEYACTCGLIPSYSRSHSPIPDPESLRYRDACSL